MLLKDSGIFSPKIDSSQNLVFTIKVKKQDYTEAMQQFIFDSYNQWKQLDLEVVGLQEKNDEIQRLRQRLALVMKEYTQKTKTSEESNKKLLYLRYNVTSRTELTREQLEEAIRFYSDWIMYDI
jgi:cell shape-determining protein MreC